MTVSFEVLKAGSKQLGVATFNTEKSLNSLTLQMILDLHAKLNEWSSNDQVVGVLIKGQGRAFCAGGDIRALYDSMKDRSSYVQNFFEKEYALDAAIHSYPKPVIVWGHGICMGGGMGVMQGAKYRIATESTRMAMPEITIGLFPDVGASYFLKKSRTTGASS
jgi:enoyl-CoA hydratase/carnithine racemase